jgi:hypothetical protein
MTALNFTAQDSPALLALALRAATSLHEFDKVPELKDFLDRLPPYNTALPVSENDPPDEGMMRSLNKASADLKSLRGTVRERRGTLGCRVGFSPARFIQVINPGMHYASAESLAFAANVERAFMVVVTALGAVTRQNVDLWTSILAELHRALRPLSPIVDLRETPEAEEALWTEDERRRYDEEDEYQRVESVLELFDKLPETSPPEGFEYIVLAVHEEQGRRFQHGFETKIVRQVVIGYDAQGRSSLPFLRECARRCGIPEIRALAELQDEEVDRELQESSFSLANRRSGWPRWYITIERFRRPEELAEYEIDVCGLMGYPFPAEDETPGCLPE